MCILCDVYKNIDEYMNDENCILTGEGLLYNQLLKNNINYNRFNLSYSLLRNEKSELIVYNPRNIFLAYDIDNLEKFLYFLGNNTLFFDSIYICCKEDININKYKYNGTVYPPVDRGLGCLPPAVIW